MPSNGQVARDLQPGATAGVVTAHADRDRPRDAVRAQEHDVERVARLPAQALLRVVRRPDVERRELADDARVGDREVAGDLGPGADADAVRLRDAAVARERAGGRVAVGPHALLEGAAQLRHVRLAHDVVALVVKRRVQEEPVVLELEVLVLLANPTLAQGEKLLAFGERADGDRPFLQGNWHQGFPAGEGTKHATSRAHAGQGTDGAAGCVHSVKRTGEGPNCAANQRVLRRRNWRFGRSIDAARRVSEPEIGRSDTPSRPNAARRTPLCAGSHTAAGAARRAQPRAVTPVRCSAGARSSSTAMPMSSWP